MWTDRPVMTRRRMLKRTAAGFGMAALGSLATAAAAAPNVAAPTPRFAPRAKRVIFLFMNGGPSHLDTFDPKPMLAKYEGQQPSGDLFKKSKGAGFMPSPLAFKRSGRSGV